MLGISKDNFLTVELLVVSQKQTPNLLKRGSENLCWHTPDNTNLFREKRERHQKISSFEGILVVEFLSGTPRKPPSRDNWLIMENSSAYFEAYHHNLRGELSSIRENMSTGLAMVNPREELARNMIFGEYFS